MSVLRLWIELTSYYCILPAILNRPLCTMKACTRQNRRRGLFKSRGEQLFVEDQKQGPQGVGRVQLTFFLRVDLPRDKQSVPGCRWRYSNVATQQLDLYLFNGLIPASTEASCLPVPPNCLANHGIWPCIAAFNKLNNPSGSHTRKTF